MAELRGLRGLGVGAGWHWPWARPAARGCLQRATRRGAALPGPQLGANSALTLSKNCKTRPSALPYPRRGSPAGKGLPARVRALPWRRE